MTLNYINFIIYFNFRDYILDTPNAIDGMNNSLKYQKNIRKTFIGYIAKLLKLHIKIDALPYGQNGIDYNKSIGQLFEKSN